MSNSRAGTFSSSSIWKLMTNGKAKDSLGKPCLDYIQEKTFEKRLGRELSNETSARPTSWGNLVESVAFVQLENVENGNKQDRLSHPTLAWSGQPDYTTKNTVGDIKSPYTLKSFCELYEINTAEELKKTKPEYYWQLVSNSILAKKKYCELTIFVPYKSQLPLIRELASTIAEEGQDQFVWINWASDEELPYILENSYYQPLKKLKFKPLEGDKEKLIGRVKMATKLLNS